METRCYGCMKIKYQEPCPYCGRTEDLRNDLHQLPVGTVLREQYVVGRCLGQGGFGVTYLGWDRSLETPVAIKEYFPKGQVIRNSGASTAVSTLSEEASQFQEGLDRFLREARTLAKLHSLPNIVQVHGVFQENGTAYIVMEYLEGTTLLEYIRQRGGKLTVSETFAILGPLMKALHQVHEAGMIHRDISPDNIMLTSGGTVKLLDFGTARDMDSTGGQLAHSTQAVLKHGFAPAEQYSSGRNLDRRADEYALCATAWFCLTGKVPPDALDRLMEGAALDWRSIPGLTDRQAAALETGAAILADGRYPDLKALENALFAQEPVAAPAVSAPAAKAPQSLPEPEKKQPPKKKKKKAGRILAFLLLALLLCAGAVAADFFGYIHIPRYEKAPGPEQWKENLLMSDYPARFDGRSYFVLGSEYQRSQIKSITFLDSIRSAPLLRSWDVSENQDGSVLAWVEPREEGGDMYDLYIAATGGLRAPEDCGYLFAMYYNAESIDFGGSFHVTGDVTAMGHMFYLCEKLTELELSSFDTSGVTTMESMFYGCRNLKALELGGFDTGKVTDMSRMFFDCSDMTRLDVSGFDTAQVTDLSRMFSNCSALSSLNLSSFDTSRVRDMSDLFSGCSTLKKLDLSSFRTPEVTNMTGMFNNCKSLQELNISSFDTAKVTNMSRMLSSCRALPQLDVSSFDTAQVTDMSNMFYFCEALEALDVSGFDTSKVENMDYMFWYCSAKVKLGRWETDSVKTYSGFMDRNASMNWGKLFG